MKKNTILLFVVIVGILIPNSVYAQDELIARSIVENKLKASDASCYSNEACMHSLTADIARTVACFHDKRWGRKSATPDRPVSIDTIAFNKGNGTIWVVDFMSDAGGPNAKPQWSVVGDVKQHFIPVTCAPDSPGPLPDESHAYERNDNERDECNKILRDGEQCDRQRADPIHTGGTPNPIPVPTYPPVYTRDPDLMPTLIKVLETLQEINQRFRMHSESHTASLTKLELAIQDLKKSLSAGIKVRF